MRKILNFFLLMLILCAMGTTLTSFAITEIVTEEGVCDIMAVFEETFDSNTFTSFSDDGLFESEVGAANITVEALGDLPEDARLNIVNVSGHADAMEWFKGLLGNSANRIIPYYIYFTLNGKIIEAVGQLRISITMSDEFDITRVVFIEPDEQVTEVEFTNVNDTVTFYGTVGYYALEAAEQSVSPTPSPSASPVATPVVTPKPPIVGDETNGISSGTALLIIAAAAICAAIVLHRCAKKNPSP